MKTQTATLIRRGPWHTIYSVKSVLCADGMRRLALPTGELMWAGAIPAYVRIDGKAVVGTVYGFNRRDPELSTCQDPADIDYRFAPWEDQTDAATVVQDRAAYLKDNGLRGDGSPR